MTVNSFYSQSVTERLKIVSGAGEFIARIKYFGFYLSLYAWEGQFVEVSYNIHSNCIEDVMLMDPKDELLHAFAVRVSLADIFST